MLSDDELLRYSRQILLPEIDLAGQEKLRAASVLIVGAGGLASPAALYLAGAGVQRLLIADGDTLEISNLHRQIGFREADIGSNKAQALADHLGALNADVEIEAHPGYVDESWLASAVPSVDVVLDCSDNFATRTMVNAACVRAKKPLVAGAAIRFSGQLAVFDLRRDDAACYACLYGDGVAGRSAAERTAAVIRRTNTGMEVAGVPQGPGLPGLRNRALKIRYGFWKLKELSGVPRRQFRM